MEEFLVNKVIESADRAEIRGEKLDDLLLWFNHASIQAAMLSLYEKGLMEIADFKDGDPCFELTEAGKNIYEKREKIKKD